MKSYKLPFLNSAHAYAQTNFLKQIENTQIPLFP